MSALVSNSDGIGRNIFCRKMEKTQPMVGEKDRKVLFSRQSRHFNSIVTMIKVLFPIGILTWRVNYYVYRKENVKTEDTKLPLFVYSLSPSLSVDYTLCD